MEFAWWEMTGREKYAEFLQSDQWHAIRWKILKARGHRCERCHSTKLLDVHHRTYEHGWWTSDPDHYNVLCRGCHNLEHGRPVDWSAEKQTRGQLGGQSDHSIANFLLYVILTVVAAILCMLISHAMIAHAIRSLR